jgi:hypothetical protein
MWLPQFSCVFRQGELVAALVMSVCALGGGWAAVNWLARSIQLLYGGWWLRSDWLWRLFTL